MYSGKSILFACLALATPAAGLAEPLSVLHSFSGSADGAYPLAPLTYQSGLLYGTTSYGAYASTLGTIFSVDPKTGTKATLYSFTGAHDGSNPWSNLVPVGSLLYGTTEDTNGGKNDQDGNIYSFDPATGALKALHGFRSGDDGAFPLGELIQKAGVLYGTTVSGGATNNGTVWSFDIATAKERVLHAFHGTDGDQPSGGVAYYQGALYGTTYDGGANNYGTVFKIDLVSGRSSVLFNFTGGNDGGTPVYSGLVVGGSLLYGVARAGGTSGSGVIYQIDPATGAETVIYNFTGGADGALPICNLVHANGVLYGTTQNGGANNVGTVFKLTLSTGKLAVLHDLQPDGSQPDYGPNAGLTLHGGTLYGITTYGGTSDDGTVYQVKP